MLQINNRNGMIKMKKSIPFSPPDITNEEVESVVRTLKSGWITTGPKTKEFEKSISKYCNTSKTICLNSATACMEMCLRMLGVGPGDEVITSAYTYTASASVIDHTGASIVLVDTEPGSYHLSLESVEKAITTKTKAIIPVDIAGVLCDYTKLFEILDRKKELFTPSNSIQELIGRVTVLADAAHSFGAKYHNTFSGNIADFTSFSFHAVKNITTAEGGALTWKSFGEEIDQKIYDEINILSLHGQTKDALSKTKMGAWEYDIISPAYKCNMTDIQASIGSVQLKRYSQILNRRKEIVGLYSKYLDTDNIEVLQHDNSSMHLMLTRIKSKSIDRNLVIRELAKKGISTNVHYKPLPLLTAYKKLGFNINKFPNAFEQYINEVTLPLHTQLSDEDVIYICNSYNEIISLSRSV
jgi:dTDP-4-amino-4,6-dideoxygalactose transaminase